MKRIAIAAGILGLTLSSQSTYAQTLGQSLRPVIRPAETAQPNIVTASVSVVALESAMRPKLRTAMIEGQAQALVQAVASNAGFDRWVAGFKQRARAQGISNSTLNAAFRDVRFDADVIRKDLSETRDICAEHGCPLEMIQKDISTVCYEPQRLFEWAKIAMEVVGG